MNTEEQLARSEKSCTTFTGLYATFSDLCAASSDLFQNWMQQAEDLQTELSRERQARQLVEEKYALLKEHVKKLADNLDLPQ